MTDLPVKPHRKTLQQTAVILNVTVRTVRRYLDKGLLKWSGNQVSVASIEAFLSSEKSLEEPTEEVEAALSDEENPRKQARRVARGTGWVNRW